MFVFLFVGMCMYVCEYTYILSYLHINTYAHVYIYTRQTDTCTHTSHISHTLRCAKQHLAISGICRILYRQTRHADGMHMHAYTHAHTSADALMDAQTFHQVARARCISKRGLTNGRMRMYAQALLLGGKPARGCMVIRHVDTDAEILLSPEVTVIPHLLARMHIHDGRHPVFIPPRA